MIGGKRLKFLLVSCLIVWVTCIKAQNFAPIAVGKYAGVHAAKINPSLTAYTPYQWHVNIIGVWGNVNNNYVNLKLPYSAYHLIFNTMPDVYKDSSGNQLYDKAWLPETLDGKRKNCNVGALAYLPSVSFKFKRLRLGVVSDLVTLSSLEGFEQGFAHASYNGYRKTSNAFNWIRWKNNSYLFNQSVVKLNSWISNGINVAYLQKLQGQQSLLYGLTVKKITGIHGININLGEMNIIRQNGNLLNFESTKINYSYYNGNTSGIGLDVGASWIYNKPEYERNGDYLKRHKQYKYKFSFSIMDIGSMRARNSNITYIENNSTAKWDVTNELVRIDDFINQNGIAQRKLKDFSGFQPEYGVLNDVFKEFSGVKFGKQDVIIGLPTRFVASIDYQYSKYVFIQTQVMQSLRGRYTQSARYQSYAMIAPRYEREKWEVSVPVLLEYDYRSLRAGLSFRAGCFYIGSNSVFNLLYTRNMRDADIYMGFTVYRFAGTKNSRFIQMMRDQIDRLDKKKPDCEKM